VEWKKRSILGELVVKVIKKDLPNKVSGSLAPVLTSVENSELSTASKFLVN
jgi:stage V sporulation protein SpoVS